MHISVDPCAPEGNGNVKGDIPTAEKETSIHQTIADDGKIIKMECDPPRTTLKRELNLKD